jgi:hypothetical protein
MSRAVFYCKGWFEYAKIAVDLWTPEKARKAHIKRSGYTILVDSSTRPSAFIETKGDVISVSVLDDFLRVYMNFAFVERAPGWASLNSGTIRQFVGDTDKVSGGRNYNFRPNGEMWVTDEWLVPERGKRSEMKMRDVSEHTLDWPEFGEYEDFLKTDRINWDW